MTTKYLIARVLCDDDLADSPDLFVMSVDSEMLESIRHARFWLNIASRVYALPQIAGRIKRDFTQGLSSWKHIKHRIVAWWRQGCDEVSSVDIPTGGSFIEVPGWYAHLPEDLTDELEMHDWVVPGELPSRLDKMEEQRGLRGHFARISKDGWATFACYNKWSGHEFRTCAISLPALAREVVRD